MNLVRVSISRIWHGPEPPTHCEDDETPLEVFSNGVPDKDLFRGKTWKCPECGRYHAWAVQSPEVKQT